MSLYETMYGKKLLENDIPKALKALENISESLTTISNLMSKSSNFDSKGIIYVESDDSPAVLQEVFDGEFTNDNDIFIYEFPVKNTLFDEEGDVFHYEIFYNHRKRKWKFTRIYEFDCVDADISEKTTNFLKTVMRSFLPEDIVKDSFTTQKAWTSYRVFNIEYDIDNAEKNSKDFNLPEEVIVNICETEDTDIEADLCESVSNEMGWLIESFDYEKV